MSRPTQPAILPHHALLVFFYQTDISTLLLYDIVTVHRMYGGDSLHEDT